VRCRRPGRASRRHRDSSSSVVRERKINTACRAKSPALRVNRSIGSRKISRARLVGVRCGRAHCGQQPRGSRPETGKRKASAASVEKISNCGNLIEKFLTSSVAVLYTPWKLNEPEAARGWCSPRLLRKFLKLVQAYPGHWEEDFQPKQPSCFRLPRAPQPQVQRRRGQPHGRGRRLPPIWASDSRTDGFVRGFFLPAVALAAMFLPRDCSSGLWRTSDGDSTQNAPSGTMLAGHTRVRGRRRFFSQVRVAESDGEGAFNSG
jgi:hypothetical protein